MILELVIVLEVAFAATVFDLIERRLRDVDMAALHQLWHLPVEERQQQSADMRAIDVRIRHDDDAVIAQLLRPILLFSDARPQCDDKSGDLLRRKQLVEAGTLYIQNLALERENCLKLPIAPLLGGAAR